MADTINISLSNVQNVKTVNIEGVGVFKVRKLGAGAELDLSDKLRRLNKIIAEVAKYDFNQYDEKTKKGKADLLNLQDKATVLMDEVHEIRKFELETYKSCFEDENGGEDVKKLFNMLSDDERVALFNQIFKPVTPLKADDEVES